MAADAIECRGNSAPGNQGMDMRRPTLALALLIGLGACGEAATQQTQPTPPPPPSVVVARVAAQELRPSIEFTGRIEAIDTVELRARVPGFLEQRLFTEGGKVEKDHLLFVIEKDIYVAAVTEAEAAVARTRAGLENAELQLGRAEELVKNKNIPEAEVDTRRALRDAAKAEVLAAEAQLEEAKINLGYTEIRAPIGGRIGKSNYSVGNLVDPASGTLATIVSQDPIRVSYPVSVRTLLDVQRERAETGGSGAGFEVRLRLADGSEYGHKGKIDFASPQVDPGTDTVQVRAVLPNPDGLLVDGALVQVLVDTAAPETVMVVPQSALLVDQTGRYVLAVNAESKVEQRRVTVGASVGTMQVIESGLAEGDLVIVEGALKVRPGQTVQASEAPAAPAGNAS
jgi:membrane fusion protein (multidrug efflux system)